MQNIRDINSRLNGRVDSSGILDEIPFVKLTNGKTFFSYPTKDYQRRMYFLLSKSLRQIVPVECLNVLFDISFRYYGPSSDQKAFDEGKYYQLNKGDNIVEIGAFIGLHSIRLSEIVGKGGNILAVEAVKSNYEMMKRNVEYNNIQNIEIVNMAVWKELGEIKFYFNEDQKNSIDNTVIKAQREEIVQCDTIDNLVANSKLEAEQLNFVRIQVNGVEKEAVEGMLQAHLNKPKILVAVPYKNREAVKQQLAEKGYFIQESKHSILAISN